jgi:hypothetical protein
MTEVSQLGVFPLKDYTVLFPQGGVVADFKALLSGLRRAEAQFERQLAGVRAAIQSLEFGGAVSPSVPWPGTHQHSVVRVKRKMSAAARAKISAAQKKRWAAVKAAPKKK